jgi:hypothetical protein
VKQWLVTMGNFDSSDGILLRVGWTGKRLQVVWSRRYALPAERRLHGKGFTGADLLADGTLLVCGFNALYRLDPGENGIEPWLVRDDFNDLHDVTVVDHGREQRVIVANTGHDRIDVFDADGKLLTRWPLDPLAPRLRQADEDPYFDEVADPSRPLHLRKLRDSVHPNAVLALPEQIWVSRFTDRALGPANGGSAAIRVPGCPHDLVPWRDRLWSTTTDGRVWSFQPFEPETSLRCEFDSFSCSGRSGWVRGLALTEELLVLGFTRISRMPRERWADRPFGDTATGLLVVDRADNAVLDWLSLAELGQHPKVFGIYPWRNT